MKHNVSNVILVLIFAVLTFGLSIEGLNSLATKYDLKHRVEVLEQENIQLESRLDEVYDFLSKQTETNNSVAIQKTGKKIKHEELDLFCMAKNIFHEASIEDELGMYAVAQVTVNRLRHAAYPNSICDVVMQPGQFTWTKNKKARWTHPKGQAWEKAKEIATAVIKDGYRVPSLQTATLYHADYVSPKWSNHEKVNVIAQIGTHIFYNSL